MAKVSFLPFAVNVMLNLSIIFSKTSFLTAPDVETLESTGDETLHAFDSFAIFL